MDIRMIALDIDGTLVRKGGFSPSPAVCRALKEAQRRGVLVVLASGRTRAAMDPGILKGVKPDYFVCANGAQVVDAAGRELMRQTLTPEEMYALVDWCEDYDYPLCFSFADGYYGYVEFETMQRNYGRATGHPEHILDGEDQDRHLQDMPFAAHATMPAEAVEGYRAKYGHLGLRFMPFTEDQYDVARADQDKAVGLDFLAKKLGIAPAQIAAAGDGHNDVGMLRYAGIGAAMGNGDEAAKAAADRVLPTVDEDGVAAFVAELLA